MRRRPGLQNSPFTTLRTAVSLAGVIVLTLVSALAAPIASADTPPGQPSYVPVQLEVMSAQGVPVPNGGVDLFAEPVLGRVQILTDQGYCLHSPEWNQPSNLAPCSQVDVPGTIEDTSFLIVPVDTTPERDGTDHDDQWFQLVASQDQKCLSLDAYQSLLDVSVVTCRVFDPTTMFRAMESPDPLGLYLAWQSILDLAVLAATTECTEDAAIIEAAPRCQVAVKDHPDQWFDPRDPNLHQYGKLGTELLGCGTAVGPDGGTFFHNGSSSTVTTSLTSSVSSTSSNTATTSYGSTTTVNASGGIKDIFSMSVNEAFQYNTSSVRASSQTQTTQSTVSGSVKPGEYLMTAWSQQAYTLDGLWKFGITIPESLGPGLAWTIPATSSYPALTDDQEDYGLVSAITSAAVKSCTASAPSTSEVKPAMTSDLATCQDAVPAPPSGEAGSWVYACPGQWSVPPGADPTPQFSYQWSITAGGGAPLIPLDGADESGFRIEPSTSGGKTVYLRVAVAEAVTSPTSRLASDFVLSPDEVTVTPVSLGSPSAPDPVRFVSRTPHALVGSPYSASLVASTSGDVSTITASGLPDGFEVSTDGTLSGTATTSSQSTITLTDAASGVTSTLDFAALEPHPDFMHGPKIVGVVGTPLSTSLVSEGSVFSTISVSGGSLPPGLALSESGTLSGTPVTSGTYRVAFKSASGNRSAVDIVIDDVPTTFASALPRGRSGEAYTAETVADPGSRALYAFAGAGGAHEPEWVTLDSATGTVSGSPTEAGSFSLAVQNVLDPVSPAAVVVIDVDPAKSSAPPTPPSAVTPVVPADEEGSRTPPGAQPAALARTGPDPWAPFGLGLVLCAGGLVLLASRRTSATE